MGAAFGAIHHVEAFGLEAAARHELGHAVLEFRVVQWFELVEPGRNPGGVDQQHEQVKAHPYAPGPQPPQGTRRAHHPQHQRRQWQADHDGQHRGFGQVLEPQRYGRFVEAKTLLQHKGAVQREGQVNDGIDHGKRCQQCHLLRNARRHPMCQCLV